MTRFSSVFLKQLCYRSVLLYAAETRSLTSVLEKKLDACQQWCLRKLLYISHIQRVTNTEVLRRTNQSQLSTVLCDRRLRLFGHVVRSDARMDLSLSRTLRAVISGLPSHWRRPPGRPRQSWRRSSRTIEKDPSALSCIGLHTTWRRAQDREQWQRTVEAALLQRGACPIDDDDDDELS